GAAHVLAVQLGPGVGQGGLQGGAVAAQGVLVGRQHGTPPFGWPLAGKRSGKRSSSSASVGASSAPKAAALSASRSLPAGSVSSCHLWPFSQVAGWGMNRPPSRVHWSDAFCVRTALTMV